MNLARISLVCLAVLMNSLLMAQLVERNKLVVAYVYSFVKNIEWPKPPDVYTIQVITSDQDLIEEFIFLSQSKKLDGRDIRVIASRSAIVPISANVVYISPEYRAAVPSIFDQVNGYQILTITDGLSNQRFVMINFKETDDQRLSFEINSANIINQNLKVLPKMVLLGGTDVDVAQLYKEAQSTTLELEARINELQKRYDSIESNIVESRKTIQTQRGLISNQTEEINNRQEIINRQNSSLDSLRNEFSVSEVKLDSLSSILTSTEEELEGLQQAIKSQLSQITEGNQTLQQQQVLIDQQDVEIQRRESRVQEMVAVVDSQQNLLILTISFSVIVVIFSLLTYRAYRARKKDARMLSEQKEELKKLLQELQEAQTQLVQSEKMASLGVLTAGIAHEINNAINFVYSGIHIIENKFSEIKPVIKRVKGLKQEDKVVQKQIEELIRLKDENNYNEAQDVIAQMIENIRIGAERTTEIVKGLRTFSRTETEALTEVDVNQELEVALLLLHSRYRDSIQIDKKLAENVPKIKGYQGQLGQAFMNIIGNAIDAVEAKGGKSKITISTATKKNNLVVTIKDNGIGMSQREIDKIFDPFFTTKKVGSGTGLGLSITFGIIKKHHGVVEVNSSENAGAEFIITLPLS